MTFPTKSPPRSLCLEKSLSDDPASAGWVLSYALLKSMTLITLLSTADGDDYLISKVVADTAAYRTGLYFRQSYVTIGNERYTLEIGTDLSF